MLVGRARLGQLAHLEVDIEVTLARTIDPVGPVKTRVEPLRAVRGGALGREHVAHLIEISARVGFIGIAEGVVEIEEDRLQRQGSSPRIRAASIRRSAA